MSLSLKAGISIVQFPDGVLFTHIQIVSVLYISYHVAH